MKKIAVPKGQKRKPIRRFTVRVYSEETALKLEGLAESTGYREISTFFVESALRSAEGGLTPWELQALEVLTFQLGVQVKVVEAALKKLKRDDDAPVRAALVEQAARSGEALALVQTILGAAQATTDRGRRGRRR